MPPKTAASTLPRLIIDMRCLQDRNYAERGIGNHARCIVAQAPGPFIGLVDPDLPPLPEELADAAALLSPHAYLPGLAAGSLFVNPSPMSPNQHFLARLLGDASVRKAACVHDFIPFDEPETYLTHPINRLDYFASMAWLRRYDVLLPNSEPTAARLRELYGDVPGCVTGVALPPWMEGIAPQVPRHILMVGGDDARKNPEVLARAHAGSALLREVPLVISGSVTEAVAARLRGITRVELPGRLPEAAMRELYARAICLVVPSRAEGFSLPVIEAAAAGVPSVVSDIAAHRALVADAAWRFAPEDAAGLAAILEGMVREPARRAAAVAAQAGVHAAFTARAVGSRVWQGAALARPAVARGTKPRIAVVSPMPPEKSGIADYTAAFVQALRPMATVRVFSGPAISALAHLDGKFDRVISAVGNAPLHDGIYDQARRWGSAVICHDARLLGLASGRGLDHAAAVASAELGRTVSSDEIEAWASDERQREASFLGELAQAARPLIFHSPQPVALVRERFGVAARFVPFAIQREFAGNLSAETKAQARRALGLPQATKLIASFGFVTRGKDIATALRALALLRETMDCRLVFVGQAGADAAVFEKLSVALGVRDVVMLGRAFVSEADYRQYLLAADCGLQLREGGSGNISGALQDCIAAGLPSVASRDLADNLGAPIYVRRVSDAAEPEEIAAALASVLAANSSTEWERDAYCAAHSMAGYARAVLAAVDCG